MTNFGQFLKLVTSENMQIVPILTRIILIVLFNFGRLYFNYSPTSAISFCFRRISIERGIKMIFTEIFKTDSLIDSTVSWKHWSNFLFSLLFQYYEMSYGLNVEMHKQTEICKRLDAIIRQVLPFLSGEVRTLFYTRCLDLVVDGNDMGIANLRQSQTYANHILF